MKKLKLNKTAFAGAEVLSRAQLKNVMGGNKPPATGICDSWKSNPETCYNCCITVHSLEDCSDKYC